METSWGKTFQEEKVICAKALKQRYLRAEGKRKIFVECWELLFEQPSSALKYVSGPL